MSDKNQTPDRAGSYDDVPTYRKDATSAAQGDGEDTATAQFPQTSGGLFNRSGRAAPQEIPAYTDQDFAAPANTGNETFAYDRPKEQPTTITPMAVTSTPAAAPVSTVTEYDQGSTAVATDAPDHRRGTIDFGLLIVRVMLGLWLILEAVGTFFRLGGNPGLSGLEADYAGYLAPGGLAIIVPALQLAAGVFLLLGLITPVFAMVATVATSFTALHELTTSGAGLNVFAWPESVWLSLVLLGSSLALQFTGPGFISLDYGRSWARRPLVSSWIFLVLAIAGGIALWWFGAGVNPLV
ncbi:DoxX family protein [Corynebacterium hylobatis]|uniref:DoxX family protein n=1 Tax=Corynebacterium hylobatis TaxID=1859290 RepID=A0A3R9ZKU0_9CORY|nr:DoxX family protein [Corynebacterium hylobatis]RSZ66113.1 DoxX family protein [Corynebacterium hylobatis]